MNAESSNEPSSPKLVGAFGNRSGPRSRAGCWTCREKKVKCCETRPKCQRCVRLSRHCDYAPRPRKRIKGKSSLLFPTEDHATDTYQFDDDLCTTPSTTDMTGQEYLDTYEELDEKRVSNVPGTAHRVAPGEISLISSSRTSNKSSVYNRPSPADYTGALSLMSSFLTPATSSPSGLVLSLSDHEAIRFYRTSFTKTQHIKNPRYSVPSVIFRLAESSPMVMHMVLAVAGRHVAYLSGSEDDDTDPCINAVHNYCQAIRLMGEAVNINSDSSKLDDILAALWLMLVYEQRFGDSRGLGVSNHLKGAASILQANSRNLPGRPREPDDLEASTSSMVLPQRQTERRGQMSYFSSRMVVWMAAMDASAASYGLGGHFNRALIQSFELDRDIEPEDLAKQYLTAVGHHSRPLFRSVWGEEYPWSEVVEDVENWAVFELFRESYHIRYLIAELASMPRHDKFALTERSASLARAILTVGERYSDLLEMATGLRSKGHKNPRFVSSIRLVVPHYHATILDFYRTAGSGYMDNDRRTVALRDILTLAFHSYNDDGNEAMFRIAWPLFMAGLETDDPIHRQWILDRFRTLGQFGKNYKRAFKFLDEIAREQDAAGDRIPVLHYLESGRVEPFFI